MKGVFKNEKIYKLFYPMKINKKEVKVNMSVNKNMVTIVIATVLILATSAFVVAVGPSGATVTPGTSSSAPEDAAGNDTNALAGNVTNLNLFGFTTTQSWQGYFGNVSGTIQLADSSDNVLYNWSLASPEGEVYSSNESSINWTGIDCFNLSANHVALEAQYGIASDDLDGVNETFNLNNHPEYFTNNIQFTAGECSNTRLYNSSGDGHFYQTLMTDGSYATQVIYTSILEEADADGFDGTFYDFEMIVLEDGHGTDTATMTYYFWVELE
jgi:hypothetical protein